MTPASVVADEFTFEIGDQCTDRAEAVVARLASREPVADRRCHATANAIVDVDPTLAVLSRKVA